MFRFICGLVLVIGGCCGLAGNVGAGPVVLREWRFDGTDDLQGWTQYCHLSDGRVEGGAFRATLSGIDPFLISPEIEIPATRGTVVEFRLQTDAAGSGNLFYASSHDGPYGGFSPEKTVTWQTIPGRWADYRIEPFWEAEPRIVKFRLDLPDLSPSEVNKKTVAIESIRLVDFGAPPTEVSPHWIRPKWGCDTNRFFTAEAFSFPISSEDVWVSVTLISPKKGNGTIRFATETGDYQTVTTPLNGGKIWNVRLPQEFFAGKKIERLGLRFDTPDLPNQWDALRQHFLGEYVESIQLSDRPEGPAEIRVDADFSGPMDAIPRVGESIPFDVRLVNDGGTPTEVTMVLDLPNGVSLQEPAYSELENKRFRVIPGLPLSVTLKLCADEAVDGSVGLSGLDAEGDSWGTELPLCVLPKPTLPISIADTEYIPEPIPVESDYNIGALYFPGWDKRTAWDKIEQAAPIRKPLLGWYDEGDPECIDWQIKWGVESGIRYFLVDWYWDRGNRHLEHWINGFQKARFKRHMKWGMMWANHNPPGSHSEEDQAAVVEFWITHYFNTPEYYTIDGKPVVMIWSPENIDRDIIEAERQKGNRLEKSEGVRRLLDLSRDKARQAGFPGIYFIAMKWPEASANATDIDWLRDAGFDATSIYHFMDHGGKAENSRWFDFSLTAEASLPYWQMRQKTGILPFFPNLSTGWDDRPWHGDRGMSIVGRTVEKFGLICDDFKTFSAETGIRDVVIAPLNEWGEGSYIEPNREFGFGMYEVLRESLCREPVGGWPPFYGPRDIGRGPYDLPPSRP